MTNSNSCIAIFSAYMPPHIGGIERYVDNLSRQLLKIGFQPIIVTSNYDNQKEYENIDGVIVIRLPIYDIFKNRYPIVKSNRDRKKLMNLLDGYDIKRIIVNTRFHLTSHVGINYGFKHHIPVYLIEHGSNYVTLDNKFIDFFANRYEDFLTWRIKNKVEGFYGVSEACGKWLKKFKIDYHGVWYNSIDCSQKVPSKRKHKNINFMYAGRIIKQKGVENILIAFRELSKKYKNIHLFIAGDGSELLEYQKVYQNHQIEFLGKLDYSSLLRYYAMTDVFLYPPLWPEGLPTSILEAGLMSCAVIGTAQGGITEIIKNQENGLIVSENSEALSHGMEQLIISEELRLELASALHETVQTKFSWEATAKKIVKDMGLDK